MPENDLRQTMMLHQDDIERFTFDDPWKLADYGDGWGAYAISRKDQVLIEEIRRCRPGRRR